MHVVPGDDRNLNLLSGGFQFVEYLDCLENSIEIRVLGIGETKGCCSIQAGITPNHRTFDISFKSNIIVAVHGKDKRAPLIHQYKRHKPSIK